ncbi:SapC family protein [Catenovulum sp. SM1970]|uniref:SapC family protein n=1 Tax=Marinifaba aquimaris TaxID=2741323 RepID=UPI00157183AA|nr:SapC family protein [Marinifaba aquimaris]NTS76739.1 SapC family protein [Marinifaba aquimaris]
MAKVSPINAQAHANTKIKQDPGFAHSQGQHLIPIVVHEFAPASQDTPIVFIKDSETGRFMAMSLVGLKPGENVLVGEQWKGTYIPQVLRNYPLVVAKGKEEGQAILCLHQDSPLISETEGEALFDENGEQTQWCKKMAEQVISSVEQNQITQGYVQYLAEKQLIAPQTLNMNISGEQYSLNGLYVINEQALNDLADETLLEMKKLGYLMPTYAALLSQQRVHNLARIKTA